MPECNEPREGCVCRGIFDRLRDIGNLPGVVWRAGVSTIRTVFHSARPGFVHSVTKTKNIVVKNPCSSFYSGVSLIIVGAFIPVFEHMYLSRFMIVSGGLVVGILFYYWVLKPTGEDEQLLSLDSEQGPDAVLVDEPPRYSSLITDPDMYKVAPPPYDEVCHVGDHHPQQQLSDAVTLCSVHQALTDTRHQAASASPGSGLGRSRSLGDLHSREALLS